MAGIYLHIPYCKQKCHYCDFHFSTLLDNRKEMLRALLSEIDQRQDFLEKEVINTIYFGGGTPSLFTVAELDDLIGMIRRLYTVSDQAEITMEANPDDLSYDKLKALSGLGINRLSVGVQSFDDEVLKWMNRAHTAKQVYESLDAVRKAGIENVTLDLIYGIPETDLTYWEQQLEELIRNDFPHLSAYCLTIEPKTAFGTWLKQGKMIQLADEKALEQFRFLTEFMPSHGFEQYEISNFAKAGFISRHNSAYWLGEKYLGIGPSAHSFNGVARAWNVANNSNYIRQVLSKEEYSSSELLSTEDRFNEYILTRLRTKWGIYRKDMNHISKTLHEQIKPDIERHLKLGNIRQNGEGYYLTGQGKFIADAISSDLFV